MRLPPIPPPDLTAKQRRLYDTLQAGMTKQFQGFRTTRADGALLGPFNPWLHKPEIGQAVWDLTEAVSKRGALSDAAAGNDLTHVHHPDLPHGFIQMTAHSRRCLEATEELARLLGGALRRA